MKPSLVKRCIRGSLWNKSADFYCLNTITRKHAKEQRRKENKNYLAEENENCLGVFAPLRLCVKIPLVVAHVALCILCFLCVSLVVVSADSRNHSKLFRVLLCSDFVPQGSELDYSKFLHSSQRHVSLACTSCHERTQDNSALPRFPGHKACTNCHLSQFVTPGVPMCFICHTDTSTNQPPLRNFPASFKESFNVKFDHAQHMNGAARPQNGCIGCHNRPLNRGVALSIPADLAAHTQCYGCHTPSSKSAAGREIASCGVCHEANAYSSTLSNARSYRYAFSHAKHGAAQRLQCTNCHDLSAGAPQRQQVSSPSPAEHFPVVRGKNCSTCHNAKRTFGGDLDFKNCRRCHTGATFKMPI